VKKGGVAALIIAAVAALGWFTIGQDESSQITNADGSTTTEQVANENRPTDYSQMNGAQVLAGPTTMVDGILVMPDEVAALPTEDPEANRQTANLYRERYGAGEQDTAVATYDFQPEAPSRNRNLSMREALTEAHRQSPPAPSPSYSRTPSTTSSNRGNSNSIVFDEDTYWERGLAMLSDVPQTDLHRLGEEFHNKWNPVIPSGARLYVEGGKVEYDKDNDGISERGITIQHN
jgi:hypothetical protein